MSLKVIPLLGTIETTVGVAPFQYPYSNPNCLHPLFMNGNWIMQGAYLCQMGENGLKYCYGSIPNWDALPATADDNYGNLVQFAGGVIDAATGVNDWLALLANPTEFFPLRIAVNQELGGCDSSTGSLFVNGGPNDAAFNDLPPGVTYPVWQTELPNALASSQTVTFSTTSFLQSLTPGSLNVFKSYPLVVEDAADNIPVFMAYRTLGAAWATQVFDGSQFQGAWTYGPLVTNHPTPCSIVTVQNNQVYSLSIATSIRHGVVLFCQVSVPFICAAPLNDPTLGGNPNILAEADRLYLEINADNSLLTGNDGVNLYQIAVNPDGDFLLKIVSTSIYFLLKGDLSGYFQVTFIGNDPKSALAIGGGSNCYGMDRSGFVWWQSGPTRVAGQSDGAAPTLYVTEAPLARSYPGRVNGFLAVISLPCVPCCQTETKVVF